MDDQRTDRDAYIEMTTRTSRRTPWHWLLQVLAIGLAQILGSALVSSLVVRSVQAPVFLVAFPLITMLLCATDSFRCRNSIIAVVAATLATLTTIHVLRYSFSSTWFFGPCPPEM